MSTSNAYFQFPLCLLAYGPDVQTRLTAIVGYCAVTAGRQFTAKTERYQINAIVETFRIEKRPRDFAEADDAHREILVGMHMLNVENGSIARMLEGHRLADAYRQQMEQDFGAFPTVRIRTTYLWEARSGFGMSYREFSTLCAVYAVIGNKEEPVRICRDRIRAGALGYKSAKMLFSEKGDLTEFGACILSKRADGAKPLTTDQVRYTLRRLHDRGHFARVQANQREVFFSHRLSRKKMAEILFAWKTKQAFTRQLHRQQDLELQKRIRAANRPESP